MPAKKCCHLRRGSNAKGTEGRNLILRKAGCAGLMTKFRSLGMTQDGTERSADFLDCTHNSPRSCVSGIMTLASQPGGRLFVSQRMKAMFSGRRISLRMKSLGMAL